MATKTSLLGLTKPAYTEAADIAVLNGNFDLIDKAVGQGARVYNHLDNSWFVNPINQRGQTQISENGYFVDRWMNYTGSQVLVSGGVRTTASGNTAYFSQYVESSVLRDGVYSFAAKVNGSICIRVIRISGTTITTVSSAEASFEGGYLNAIYANSGRFEFMLRVEDGNSIVTEWAALYEGAYTADTLPAYQYKGYAAELAECQRYYVKFGTYWSTGFCGSCVKISDTTCRVTFPLPTKFRTTPTITSFASCKVAGSDVTGLSNPETVGNVVTASATVDAASLSYKTNLLFWMMSGGYVEFSADL